MITVFSTCIGNITSGHLTDLTSSIGTSTSDNISWCRSKKTVITVLKVTFLSVHINCRFFIRSVFVTHTLEVEITSQIIPPPPL